MIGTQTHSAILFLTTCSLTKNRGGEPHYDENDAIASGVGVDLKSRLLARREEVRGLVKGNHDLRWQGVSLADLREEQPIDPCCRQGIAAVGSNLLSSPLPVSTVRAGFRLLQTCVPWR